MAVPIFVTQPKWAKRRKRRQPSIATQTRTTVICTLPKTSNKVDLVGIRVTACNGGNLSAVTLYVYQWLG